jgi:hypothetical protein
MSACLGVRYWGLNGPNAVRLAQESLPALPLACRSFTSVNLMPGARCSPGNSFHAR